MPCCSAPFVTSASLAGLVEKGVPLAKEEAARPPWTPVQRNGIMWHRNAVMTPAEVVEAARPYRDTLAQAAKMRYGDWKARQPPSTAAERRQRNRQPLRHGSDHQTSFWRHSFRDRDPGREMSSTGWASASQLSTQHERIQTALSNASTTYMQHPPYPKQGGGPRNFAFSHMSAAYDYRARQPSKEVAGTCPIMRVRPRTESARINEEVSRTRLVDVHAGGNWTRDPKYGNPITHSAQSVGNTFRSQSPELWMTASSSSKDQKWRGNFATYFPPPTSTADFEPMGDSQPGWLHHEEPFVEQ